MSRINQRREETAGTYPASVLPGELGVNLADNVLYMGGVGGTLQYPVAIRPFSEDASYMAGEGIFKDSEILVATVPVSPGPFSAGDWSTISLSPFAAPLGPVDWDFAITYTAGLATEVLWSQGDLRVRETLSYTAGGLIDTILYEISLNAGVDYSTVKTITLSYDADGLVDGGTGA